MSSYVIHDTDSNPPRFLDGYDGQTKWEWTLNPYTAWGFSTSTEAMRKAERIVKTRLVGWVEGSSRSFGIPKSIERSEAQKIAKKFWGVKSETEFRGKLRQGMGVPVVVGEMGKEVSRG